ncbi:hypothetical protein ACCO44_01470 [Microbacterium maritypicum]|uniref:hypothetical protein n=1 Tax=Microbacterium maritypicum TaxID=33918 RepID=UPI00355606D8
MFPDTPPPAGSPISTFEGSNGETYSLKTIDAKEWIINGPPGIGTQIRRLTEPESGFSFLRTDGKNPQAEHVNAWADIAAFF